MLTGVMRLFSPAETEVSTRGCGFSGAHCFFTPKGSEYNPALHMIFDGRGARHEVVTRDAEHGVVSLRHLWDGHPYILN